MERPLLCRLHLPRVHPALLSTVDHPERIRRCARLLFQQPACVQCHHVEHVLTDRCCAHRQALRQAIAGQKASEPAPAGAKGGEGHSASQMEAADRHYEDDELEALIKHMESAGLGADAHVRDDASQRDAGGASNPYELAGAAKVDAWGDPLYAPLPLPTHEAGVEEGVEYQTFQKEDEMAAIVALIDKDLSEPYSILTYRYFVYNWSQHTHMAMYEGKCCGVVVCKLEQHRDYFRGYIAMLAVDEVLRGKGIGSCLVSKAIRSMRSEGCEEVVLETECSNTGALNLYERLGFFRDKRLLRYYLNGGDAFRLKLWFPGCAYYT